MSLVWKHLKADTAALSIAANDVADRCFAPSRVPTDQRPGKGDRAASPAPHDTQDRVARGRPTLFRALQAHRRGGTARARAARRDGGAAQCGHAVCVYGRLTDGLSASPRENVSHSSWILDHFIAEFGPGEIVEAVASAVADDDVFGIDSADTLSGNVVVGLPMDVIRSALKAKLGADRWAQEINAFKDENGPPIICVQSCCRGSWRGGGGDSPPRQGD